MSVWAEKIQRDKENIIEDLSKNIRKEHSWLVTKKLVGDDYDRAREIVKTAVFNNRELLHEERLETIQHVMGRLTGYGPLQELFVGRVHVPGIGTKDGMVNANEITEIMIVPAPDNKPPIVFFGCRGRRFYAGNHYFHDNQHLLQYCQKICDDSERSLITDSPIQDAWLKDGTRVNVIAFGASPLGPTVTMRKSPLLRPPLPMEELVKSNMLPEFAARLCRDVLNKGYAKVGIFGRTDSGKTTFMKAFALFYPPTKRIIIAETSYEFFLPGFDNCLNLVEVISGGKVIVDMTMLCNAINRSNPDISVVGELRSKEIVAALQIAASTNCFLTTGHAGSISDLRIRIAGMHRDAGIELPRDSLDETISTLSDFIIFFGKETKTQEEKRTMMSMEEVIPGGYRTIIRFDFDEFAASGKRQWIYENTISKEMLSHLAFQGAELLPEYKEIKQKYLY
ncbi:Type IV secretion system protein PtlH [Pelotomaculum schinkii]|uniref:Type IV secretion system protein PtlH n=1 Tax=Pelotomaculum schinkii TaxID=78350 RepID=A0A4Y7R7U2_9FIRM|nr:ATPase, T2SS/T4P/T4SS family [Pelotomaculum schinkii]TEB04700.1 Type IV secretion system protein PtlH [Pelotomaculum schinkii]